MTGSETCTLERTNTTYGGGGGEDIRRFSRLSFGLPLGSAAFEWALNWMDGRRGSFASTAAVGSNRGLAIVRGAEPWTAGEAAGAAPWDVGETLILVSREV